MTFALGLGDLGGAVRVDVGRFAGLGTQQAGEEHQVSQVDGREHVDVRDLRPCGLDLHVLLSHLDGDRFDLGEKLLDLLGLRLRLEGEDDFAVAVEPGAVALDRDDLDVLGLDALFAQQRFDPLRQRCCDGLGLASAPRSDVKPDLDIDDRAYRIFGRCFRFSICRGIGFGRFRA